MSGRVHRNVSESETEIQTSVPTYGSTSQRLYLLSIMVRKNIDASLQFGQTEIKTS